MTGTRLGERVFRDAATLSLYGEIGADDSRAHKRLMIQMPDGDLKEITNLKDAAVAGSGRERSFERYYFLDDADVKVAQGLIDSARGRRA